MAWYRRGQLVIWVPSQPFSTSRQGRTKKLAVSLLGTESAAGRGTARTHGLSVPPSPDTTSSLLHQEGVVRTNARTTVLGQLLRWFLKFNINLATLLGRGTAFIGTDLGIIMQMLSATAALCLIRRIRPGLLSKMLLASMHDSKISSGEACRYKKTTGSFWSSFLAVSRNSALPLRHCNELIKALRFQDSRGAC